MYAAAHVLFLSGHADTPNFQEILSGLDRTQPGYAPLRFLKSEIAELEAMSPILVRAESFALLDRSGAKIFVELSAVMVRVGDQRAAVIFVDNRSKIIYGQIYVDTPKEELERRVHQIADEVMTNLRAAYRQEAALAARDGISYPAAGNALENMKEIITSMTKGRGGS
jgi:hypothetical protein